MGAGCSAIRLASSYCSVMRCASAERKGESDLGGEYVSASEGYIPGLDGYTCGPIVLEFTECGECEGERAPKVPARRASVSIYNGFRQVGHRCRACGNQAGEGGSATASVRFGGSLSLGLS
eukprot:351361-Pleurochrysis_carterae.AAC.2